MSMWIAFGVLVAFGLSTFRRAGAGDDSWLGRPRGRRAARGRRLDNSAAGTHQSVGERLIDLT